MFGNLRRLHRESQQDKIPLRDSCSMSFVHLNLNLHRQVLNG